ncbi:hypothetical protein [Sphaerotilus sp.]|uniref:hypothetical protein n=1 Tax=Sphaerotilus sp. TaxID=2093942 RepID=UPI002ACE97C8|nr:hypothetical protein [Sphaerotilus sp.]MDZ7855758.1 hypothetical protein [Sphaerotilus sp.]
MIEADLDENDYCLYSAISDGPDGWTEHVLDVSRDAICELLACTPISGSLVYRAVCPSPVADTATP